MKILSSREVMRSPIFRVTEEHAVAPDGFQIRRSIVQHGGSAVMLAVDERGRVLLVRQYRLPARASLWELPAGRLDEGETPLKAARRELLEETGYRARTWKKLVSFYASPGYVSEKLTIYVATGLARGQAQPMDDERIECRWFTQRELRAWIRAGKLRDAKTLIGLLLWSPSRPWPRRSGGASLQACGRFSSRPRASGRKAPL
ncbi:MAG: NUDIX hydrolase [Acidobacteria bacterium]|nr:NUDIX hydrolase [Acidobacteriota bacterium]